MRLPLGFVIVAAIASPALAAPDDPKPARPKMVDVINEVSGKSVILTIVDDGSVVKKGDVVCQMDSAGLKDALVNQEIAINKAQAELAAAIKTREVAVIESEELKGLFAEELQAARGEIKVAESGLALAKEQLRKAPLSGEGSFKTAVLQAQLTLKAAEGKLDQLVKFNHPRRLAESDAALKKAQADEALQKAIHDAETAKAARLKIMIARCTILAPADGRLVYVVPSSPDQPIIEEGAVLRERQRIARIVVE